MIYNIAEIKYTSCYPVICNLVPKRPTLPYHILEGHLSVYDYRNDLIIFFPNKVTDKTLSGRLPKVCLIGLKICIWAGKIKK